MATQGKWWQRTHAVEVWSPPLAKSNWHPKIIPKQDQVFDYEKSVIQFEGNTLHFTLLYLFISSSITIICAAVTSHAVPITGLIVQANMVRLLGTNEWNWPVLLSWLLWQSDENRQSTQSSHLRCLPPRLFSTAKYLVHQTFLARNLANHTSWQQLLPRELS